MDETEVTTTNQNDTKIETASNTAVSSVPKPPAQNQAESGELVHANEAMYKQNVELAVLNKNLALLRKLYQISLLTLDPKALGDKITEAVRMDLNLEIVGVLTFDEAADTLSPLSFAKTKRLEELLNKLGFLFKGIEITKVSTRPFFKAAAYGKISSETNDLADIWSGLVTPENLEVLKKESYLKTTLLYPLITEMKVLGVLLLGLNRDYNTLNDHEKDSIKSLIDVVSVAMDKTFLYKEIQDANEKLKSLDKLKTEFLGLASHQLRSPLTAIKGYSSMLLENSWGEIKDEGQKMAINRIFESSKNLANVVEDLLNVSKIEQGGMQYEMTAIDMKKMAQDLVQELSVSAKNKGLALTFEEKDLGEYVAKADRVKIRQVLLNLIDNSIKYTKEGFIKLIMSRPNPNIIRMSITDSGMGIPPEIIGTLFAKFSRGEGGKVNAGGSGLGLYLAKEIVAAHGGKVWAESPGAGKGSTFIVELPQVANPPDHYS